MKPKVVIGAYPEDHSSVERTLAWCDELGLNDADLVIVAESGTPVVTNGDRAFTSKTLMFYDVFTPVRQKKMEAGLRIHRTFRAAYPDTPYLLMEHDSIPLIENWFSRILSWTDIYPAEDQIVSGAWVEPSSGEPYVPYINGVALYPSGYNIADIPESCWGYDRTNCQKFHPSIRFIQNPSIVHEWGENGPPTFRYPCDVSVMLNKHPFAALFHRCIDGTLIERLREERKQSLHRKWGVA